MMLLGRPVRTIAQLVGIEADYCRKLCRQIASDRQIVYNPGRVYKRSEMQHVGLTDKTRRLRAYLGGKLYELGSDSRAVANKIGMTQRCQKYARERPFNHDWTISQIERLAEAHGTDAITLIKEALNA